jgi:hypothetical protein
MSVIACDEESLKATVLGLSFAQVRPFGGPRLGYRCMQGFEGLVDLIGAIEQVRGQTEIAFPECCVDSALVETDFGP